MHPLKKRTFRKILLNGVQHFSMLAVFLTANLVVGRLLSLHFTSSGIFI